MVAIDASSAGAGANLAHPAVLGTDQAGVADAAATRTRPAVVEAGYAKASAEDWRKVNL